MMNITKEEIRQIVREEIERGLRILLDAKITATAIKHNQFFSDVPLTLRNKSVRHKKSS